MKIGDFLKFDEIYIGKSKDYIGIINPKSNVMNKIALIFFMIFTYSCSSYTRYMEFPTFKSRRCYYSCIYKIKQQAIRESKMCRYRCHMIYKNNFTARNPEMDKGFCLLGCGLGSLVRLGNTDLDNCANICGCSVEYRKNEK